jgi:hypothetical protein
MKKLLLSLLLLSSNTFAAITDGKFGINQIFDVQYWWNGNTLNASSFIAPYNKNFQTVTVSAGQYFQFFPSTTNPGKYGLKLMNSNDTQHSIVHDHGDITALGNGAIFYIGSGFFGNVITTSQGYNYGASAQFTNMDTSVTASDLSSYTFASSTPLSAGQTAAPAAPVVTVTGTSTSYTTRNVVSGNTTTIYRTLVTTTNYSDGTSTNANGTEALYQTRVSTAVVTNKIVNGVLTTYSTPVVKVTTVGGGAATLESNGLQSATTQTVNQGLRADVFRYDPKNYNCFLGICAWDFTYHTPSTNSNNYGNPVNSYRTTNGMFFSTNSNLPNNDNSLLGRNDGTVIRFKGTITAPTTASKPAGTVYRLYFYNNSDDGFKMTVNGGTVINQNETVRLQSLFGTTSSGYMDVVAGQTYNLEAWYWNTYGGLGHTLYWDFGDGMRSIPNSAFTDGTIGNIDIDLTGFNYSNPAVVPVEGTASSLWPEDSEITSDQLLQKNAAKARVAAVGLGNSVHIDQKIGSSGNAITIEQTGNYNKISGLGGTDYAIINGDNNTINIKQGDTLGKNLIEFSVTGNTNNITLWQARNPTTGLQDGNESGGHYMGLNINGSTNTLSLKQSNDGGSNSGHFAYVDVTGNNNNGTLKQSGNGEKTFFGIINGNTNIFDITQQGSGSYLDLSLTGNGHNVSANQKEAGSHKATINLTNAGGASTVNLVQQGTTAQNINITQQCATLSGCSVSVTQGGGP